MSERPEPYRESEGAYIEKVATFIFRDGRWDIALYNESFKSNEKYFRVRIPVPAELISGTIDVEVTKAKK